LTGLNRKRCPMATSSDLEAELERQRPIIEAVAVLMEFELKLEVAGATLASLESRAVPDSESTRLINLYVEALEDSQVALGNLRKVAGGWRG